MFGLTHPPLRFRFLRLVCGVFALLLGCLFYSFAPAQAAVFDSYPQAGGTCDVKDSIVIYFDEEIDASDFNNSNVVLIDNSTGLGVSLNSFQYHVIGGKTTLTVDPVNDLYYDTAYTLDLSNLGDKNSAAVINYTLNFSTINYTNRLQVVSASPADGDTNISISAYIRLTFNKPIQYSSVDNHTVFLTDVSTGNIVATTWQLSNASGVAVLTITPAAPLAHLTPYRLNIINSGAYALRDLTGQTMAADTLDFITQPITTPVVTSRTPDAGDINVAINTLVSVTFNQAMDPATLNKTNIRLLKNGSMVALQPITYQSGTFTINVIPFTVLDPGATYTVELLNAVTDISGNALPTTSWSFTTAGGNAIAPSLGSVSLAYRDPSPGASGVPVNKDISFQFNNSMNSSTINSSTVTLTQGGNQVPYSFVYNSGNQVTIRPTSTLLNNSTYTVNLSGAIRDLSGNYLVATSWSFSTGYSSGYYTGYGSAYPSPNSSGVPLDTEISYYFGTRLSSSALNSSNVYLSYSGGRVSCSIDYDSSNYRVTLRPYGDLNSYTTYNVNISGIQDYYGSYISPISWSFTTGNRYDYDDYYNNRYYNNDYQAGIFERSPESNASGVALDKTISFRFDRTIRSSTIDSNSIYLTRNGSKVAASVSYNSSSRAVIIYPDSNLQPDSEYTVRVSSGVRDYDGYSVGSASWTFRTRGTQNGSSSYPSNSWYSLQGTAEHPLVMLNGQNLSFDVQPYIKNGRTFLPYRTLLEALGAGSINWDAKRRTVTAAMDGNNIELTICYKIITRNGATYSMDVAPEIRDNRTMIPLRFVSEHLGFNTDWDAANHVIYLTK